MRVSHGMKESLTIAGYTLILLFLQLAFIFSAGFNMFFLALFIGLVSFLCIVHSSDSSDSIERKHHD